MNLLSRGGLFFAALLVTLVFSAPASAQQQNAMVRIAHLSPDAPYVDVYIDGMPVGYLTGVSYGTVSPYLRFSTGTHTLTVFETGNVSTPLLSVDLTSGPGESQTLGILGLMSNGTLEARLYDDDTLPTAAGEAKVRAVHAVPDMGAASVTTVTGERLLVLPGFSSASLYAQMPVGNYTLQLRPTGTSKAALTLQGVGLASGEVYTAFFIGSATNGTPNVIFVQDSAGSGTAGQALADTGGLPSPLVAYLTLQLMGLCAALVLLVFRQRQGLGGTQNFRKPSNMKSWSRTTRKVQ